MGALRSILPARAQGSGDGTRSRATLLPAELEHGGCGVRQTPPRPGPVPHSPHSIELDAPCTKRRPSWQPAQCSPAAFTDTCTSRASSPGACGTGAGPRAALKHPLPQLSPARDPRAARPCRQPRAGEGAGQGGGDARTRSMALAHLSEHLNLPALYDGAIQLLPCPVGICASFKSYKPKTL